MESQGPVSFGLDWISGHVAGRDYGHLKRFLALAGFLRTVLSPGPPVLSISRPNWNAFILNFSHSLSTMSSHTRR
jgi:hypothetical protein